NTPENYRYAKHSPLFLQMLHGRTQPPLRSVYRQPRLWQKTARLLAQSVRHHLKCQSQLHVENDRLRAQSLYWPTTEGDLLITALYASKFRQTHAKDKPPEQHRMFRLQVPNRFAMIDLGGKGSRAGKKHCCPIVASCGFYSHRDPIVPLGYFAPT